METTEIEVLDIEVELQVFDPVANAIAEAKTKNANLVFDYEDKQGNKDARSHIFALRQLKAPVNEVHKLAKAEALKFTKALDAKKRELIGAVDEMIEVHHRPIREIEERERAKKEEEERIAREKAEAEEAKRLAELEAREQAVREQEEKLRAEKEELERKEREARIAEEAKKKAEEEARQAVIDAENRRLADIEREKQKVREEAEAKEQARLERERADRAAELELQAQEQVRIADIEHRRRVHTEIYNSLKGITDDPTARIVFTAIKDGQVPHITIQY